MTETTRTKLIKKSQVAGLARSTGSRKSGIRLHVEEACRKVYATRRPAVDSVLREGAGRFSRASVEKPERHGHIVKLWQKTWDEEHPEEAERLAARRAVLPAVAEQPAKPAPDSGKSAEERRVADQLKAALDEIERLDRQHLMDVELIEELRLDLRRAKAEPRKRLPRRFSSSDDGSTHH